MTQTMQLSKVNGNRGLSLRLASAATYKLMGTAVAGLLLLGACASAPQPPTADLQAAELAIANAERARVADYASVELSEARDKLTAARNAVQEEQMSRAQRLAQQARVDAELASARAEVAKARVVNEQMQKGTDTLKQEMQRTTGDR
ncbi:MAG TPA: DUF4398 domain-containing protein [Gammaproteobacteria bacterium]